MRIVVLIVGVLCAVTADKTAALPILPEDFGDAAFVETFDGLSFQKGVALPTSFVLNGLTYTATASRPVRYQDNTAGNCFENECLGRQQSAVTTLTVSFPSLVNRFGVYLGINNSPSNQAIRIFDDGGSELAISSTGFKHDPTRSNYFYGLESLDVGIASASITLNTGQNPGGIDNLTIEAITVPAPATLGLVAAGLLLLGRKL